MADGKTIDDVFEALKVDNPDMDEVMHEFRTVILDFSKLSGLKYIFHIDEEKKEIVAILENIHKFATEQDSIVKEIMYGLFDAIVTGFGYAGYKTFNPRNYAKRGGIQF